MKPNQELPPPSNQADSPTARWELVNRISATSYFARSPRLIQLLEHLTERSLAGHPEDLSEQKIGVQVFARPADYSPAEDNIVRAHARLLRQKLDQYYAAEGASDTYRLSIPKGGYLPNFELTTTDPEAPTPEPSAPPLPPSPHKKNFVPLALALLVGLVIGATPFLFNKFNTSAPHRPHPLWQTMLLSGRPAVFVAADSGLVMFQNLTKRPVGLTEYAKRSYLANSNSASAETLPSIFGARRYTSVTDLNILNKLLRLPQAQSAGLRLAFARDLNPGDFKQVNLILSGAAEANPWVELFLPRLSISIEKNQDTDTFTIHNRRPLAGEQPRLTYNPHDDTQFAYSHLAFLPGDGNIGHALLISGTTTAGTEAAADFVLNDTLLLPILDKAKLPNGSLGAFELLLRTRNIGGSSPQASIALSRFDSTQVH